MASSRILFLITDLESGIGVPLLNCLPALRERYDVLIGELQSSRAENKERARALGVRIVTLGRPGYHPATFFKLLRLARSFRPRIIQGFQLETNFYAALIGRLTGASAVTSWHGMITAFRKSRAPLLQAALRGSDRIVCVSRPIADLCVARIPAVAGKLHVIPNGIETDRFPPRADQPRPGRSARLIWVADFHSPAKGHPYVLSAAALFEKSEIQLSLVGDGILRKAMEELAGQLNIMDRVEFMGWRADVPRLLSESDVFVMPSLTEGCPLAPLEAMAAGLPVVATRIPGNEEILRHEVTGLLVPPRDPEALRDGVRRILNEPGLAERLRTAALRHVRENFSADRMAQAYRALYDELTGKERRGTAGAQNEAGHWPTLARQWNEIGPPLRPSPQDLAFVSGTATEWIRRHGAPRVLLLGVTPEIYRLPWPAGTDFLAVDRAPAMIDRVWPGPKDHALCAEWTSLNLSAGSRDMVICDGGLHLLSHPGEHVRLVRILHRLLSPEGLVLLRLFAPPGPCTPQTVLDDFRNGRIPNPNILKLRLGMAMQESLSEGVAAKTVWRAIAGAIPDPESHARAIGWSAGQWSSVQVYQHSNVRYHYAGLAEAQDLFCRRPGGFALKSVRVPDYDLGDHCPTVVFQRRESADEGGVR
jgi:glycosyltransferase involved in cell wall biosynthesis